MLIATGYVLLLISQRFVETYVVQTRPNYHDSNRRDDGDVRLDIRAPSSRARRVQRASCIHFDCDACAF